MSDGARFPRPSLDQLPFGAPIPLLGPGVAGLGLNEGLEGPFRSALAAIEAVLPSLNRYPGRGSFELVGALAERHQVPFEQVFVAAGADAVIGYVCQAVLEPGDEVVVAWPSFPSFVRDPLKRDAVAVAVPLSSAGDVDFGAMASAVTPRTRLVFLATPNNPTGRVVQREELLAFVAGLPEHVLPVIDEAYFDYLDPSDRFDGVVELVRRGVDALVLRTFSKLYGLAGLRVGYGVGPAAVVAAMHRVQRGYDVGAPAQAAALASLADEDEIGRRRDRNRKAVAALMALLVAHGLEPLSGSEANFVLVELGTGADEVGAALLRHGVAVQSGAPFGAPTAVRVSAGARDELDRLGRALDEAGFTAVNTL